MSGKVVSVLILIAAIAMGGGAYYATVYGYYDEVDVASVELTSLVSGEPEQIIFDEFDAIDANSSPIRYRACFTTTMSQPLLTETYELVENKVPRVGPDWFDCFDAARIETELAAGTALTFMGQKNIHYGVDRIVAITADGRGYVWHDLNDCGEKSYDGTVVGEDCPPRPDDAAETD